MPVRKNVEKMALEKERKCDFESLKEIKQHLIIPIYRQSILKITKNFAPKVREKIRLFFCRLMNFCSTATFLRNM